MSGNLESRQGKNSWKGTSQKDGEITFNWRISFVRNVPATHQFFCFSCSKASCHAAESLPVSILPVIFISTPDRHAAENKWTSRRHEITSAIHHPVCITRDDERGFSCLEALQHQYTFLFLLTLRGTRRDGL